MSKDGKTDSGWWWLLVGVVAVVGFAGGALLVLALGTAKLDNWSLWARDFVKSSGFAGLTALAAAVIAAFSIGRQVSVSRSALEAQRDASTASSWWISFEWASGRAIPGGKEDIALPDSVTIGTLQELATSAETDVQKAACKGMIEILTQRMKETEPEPAAADGTLAQDASLSLLALKSYVQANEGTPAASPAAEALVYEREVFKALAAIFPSSRVQPTSGPSGDGPDAIVLVDQGPVNIEVSYSRNDSVRRAWTNSVLGRHHRGPVVVVSRFPFPHDLETTLDDRGVVCVQWETPSDNDALQRAVLKAAAGPKGRV